MPVSVKRTVELQRPLEEVFTYLSDFAHTNEWDPGTVTTTRNGTGPVVLGTTWHNVSEFRGRKTELEYELTTYEPTRKLVFTGRNKTVTSTDDMTLTGDATRTTLVYQATLVFNGLARLAGPLLQRGFEKVADDTVAQLHKTLPPR